MTAFHQQNQKSERKFVAMALLIMLLIAGSVSAEEAAPEKDKSPWTGAGEIGFLMTGGNSDTESLNAKLSIDYKKAAWFNNTAFETVYSAADQTDDEGISKKETSAEKYYGSNKTGFNFAEASYLFLLGEYTYDYFSGYYYQTTFNVGYGHRLIKNDRMALDVEIGPGYRYSSIREPGDGDDGEEAVCRLSGMYKLKLSEKSDFQQDVSVDKGSDTTITKSVSAITAQIVGALAMKVSFTLRNDSNPPVDTKKTDRQTALTLVYAF